MNDALTRRIYPVAWGLVPGFLSGAPPMPAWATLYFVGSSGPEHVQMIDDTVYQGHKLHLVARRSPDGLWTGAASFLDEPQLAAVTAEGFASEAEALKAALSRAMAQIDVERRSHGKP
jgi:hypothetical protein